MGCKLTLNQLTVHIWCWFSHCQNMQVWGSRWGKDYWHLSWIDPIIEGRMRLRHANFLANIILVRRLHTTWHVWQMSNLVSKHIDEEKSENMYEGWRAFWTVGNCAIFKNRQNDSENVRFFHFICIHGNVPEKLVVCFHGFSAGTEWVPRSIQPLSKSP